MKDEMRDAAGPVKQCPGKKLMPRQLQSVPGMAEVMLRNMLDRAQTCAVQLPMPTLMYAR